MKKTIVCDESMIITIPIGSLNGAQEGQLLPEKFQSVYKDSYKVFALNGKPKPLGAAQVITGVFIVTLSQILNHEYYYPRFIINICTLPSVVFVVSGMLSYAAGQFPNMHVTKLSFSLNIISLFWSLVAVCVCGFDLSISLPWGREKLHDRIRGLIFTLLVVEKLMAVFLIYWLSKAPIILLKQGD